MAKFVFRCIDNSDPLLLSKFIIFSLSKRHVNYLRKRTVIYNSKLDGNANVLFTLSEKSPQNAHSIQLKFTTNLGVLIFSFFVFFFHEIL